MGDRPSSATRAAFPAEYGQRGGEADVLLDWEDADQRLRDAPNYWICTVTGDGRPYCRPVDGVWLDGALCFGGSPETRWVRNLEANPAISVHLGSGEDVLILDGRAEYITDPDHPLAAASTAASKAKYPQYYPGDEPLPFQPFWTMRPQVAYAWRLEGFPNRATRWTFAG